MLTIMPTDDKFVENLKMLTWRKHKLFEKDIPAGESVVRNTPHHRGRLSVFSVLFWWVGSLTSFATQALSNP
jgi:hypothetical protein